jgi:glutamate-5-semialdehyde dehydrogenase
METASDMIEELARQAKAAQRRLAVLPGDRRREALLLMADEVEAANAAILAANEADLASAQDLSDSQLDRLRLNPERVQQMASGLRDVASQVDVVGKLVDGWVLGNGLRVSRVRVPLGVVGIIYENRPNVTADAAALCIYSGNAVLLRGSSTAINSNRAIVSALKSGLTKAGIPDDVIGLVEDLSHDAAKRFMQLEGYIDVLIPRGGPSLIASIRENAKVPVIIDGDGNCHIYIDSSANPDMAVDIVANAKLQRPGVCNAVETLLIHRDSIDRVVPKLAAVLSGVEIRGDETICRLVAGAKQATEEDYRTEFLSLVLAVKVVSSLDEAIEHIRTYSSGHSEAIVTENLESARRFVNEIDAAAVLVNASTRFVDGGQLGMGAEIGISTQKLHARGPMGLEQLTTVKFVIEGEGQVRK